MNATIPVRNRITSWMERNGWVPVSDGQIGQMWALAGDHPSVGVPHSLEGDPEAADGIIRRLAHWSGIDAADLRDVVDLWGVDVSRFVADVPLESSFGRPGAKLSVVSHLFSGTGKIFRAAAHTSRIPKEVITNFSPKDDDVLSHALAGMTEIGSYALPVYVPVGEPDLKGSLGIPGPSEARALTKTVASALQAVETHIIIPEALDLSREVILQMVNAGVSREFLSAISELLAVDQTDAKTMFSWASSHSTVPGSSDLPTQVLLPHEAREIIEITAKQFSVDTSTVEPFQGKIKGILYDKDKDTATTVMAVPRSSGEINEFTLFNTTVEVKHEGIDPERLDQFYEWMRNGALVYFNGRVLRESGSRIIENPQDFSAMGQQGTLRPGE